MLFGIFTLTSALMIVLTYGCGCNCGCGKGNGNNGNLWISSGIVPTVIDIAPVNATMRFGTGAVIWTGIQFSLEQVDAQIASIDFDFIPGGLYSIFMLDLDYPSVQNPSESQYIIWFTSNLLGSSINSRNLDSGNVVLSYQNPNPLKNSGIHRYLIVVYLQPSRLQFQLSDRTHFNVRNYVNANQMGQPICGNYYIINTGQI